MATFDSTKVLQGGASATAGEPLSMKLKQLWKAFYAGVSASGSTLTFATPTVRVGVFGDSVGNSKPMFITPRFKQMIGDAGGTFTSTTLAGGATVTTDVSVGTYWINGNWYVVPSGGSVEFLRGGGRAAATKLKVYYVLESGAGTFKVQTNNGSGYADEGSANNVSAANATTTAGVITLTKSAGSTWSVKVVGLTGTVRILFATYEDETTKGAWVCQFDVGGLPLATADQTPAAIKTVVFNDLALDFAMAEWKDNAEFPAAFAAWTSFYAGLNLPTSWLYIGTSPEAIEETTGSFNRANNAIQETWCNANGHAYFDGYTPLAPYSKLVALGWEGDGTHLSPKANGYVASLLWKHYGFDDLMLVPTSKRVSTDSVTLQDGEVSWKRFGTEVGRIGESGTDNDFVMRANRSFRYKTIGGTTTGVIAAGGETTAFGSIAIGSYYANAPTISIEGTGIRVSDKDAPSTYRPIKASAFTVG